MVTDTRTARSDGRPELGPSPPDPHSRSAGEGATGYTRATHIDSTKRYPSLTHGRGARGEGKLRPLNSPQPIEVESSEASPAAVRLSGHRFVVEAVQETWRIDDEWWRERPVSRTYWRLFLANGCTIDVYRDDARGRWYKQAYTG